MAYTINNTSGEAVNVLADNTTASFAGLTLIGKRVTSYGEFFNENFVKLVENFRFNDAPAGAVIGQLWYKDNESQIKVKISNDPDNEKAWKTVGTPRVASSAHATPTIGDLWYDTTVTSEQLKLYNGASWVPIGPYVAVPAGTTGVDPDTNDGNIILKVSIASTVVIIISNTEFTPNPAILGFPKIYPGINFRTTNESGQIHTTALTIDDTGVFPKQNNTIDLGSSSYKFNDVYATNFQGNATSADSAVNSSNAVNFAITVDSANATFYPTFVSATTGNVAGKVNTNVTLNLGNTPANTATLTVPKVSTQQLTSTITSGTAPFIVSSNTKVDNLYVDKADKWATSRTVTFATGDVTGSFSIDGTIDVSNVELSIANTATVETKAAGTNNNTIASTAFVNTAVSSLLPTGTIVMWYGRKVDIPVGWKVCDGTNDTPDLRNRFVIGATEDSNNRPATSINSTSTLVEVGGTADAIVVAHTHSATSVVTDNGHSHSIGYYPNLRGLGGGANISDGDTNYKGTTTSTTGISVATTVASAGSSGLNANLPPYRALYYIMKG